MSWTYVLAIAEEIHLAHDIARYKVNDVFKSPSVTVTVTASAKQLVNGIDYAPLAATLLMQILDIEDWPLDNISFIINKEVKLLDIQPDCRSKSTLHSAINQTFVAALVLLNRCGIISRIGVDRNFIWNDLNFFFSDSYESSAQVDYATLHEFVMFVRSVDVHNSSVLQRIINFTRVCSFEQLCLQVMLSYHEKTEEVENMCKKIISLPTELSAPTICVRKKGFKRTFEMIDEHVDVHSNDGGITMGKKFYAAIFKEHKMLAEHLPDNIYVHAFGNRLNILHVLIIGPAGTPFENVPFFFKFKLPHDYPLKPPDGVETWIPMKSNLYQVLLSIQALVLVPEPYYNEAGYESRKEQKEMGDRSRRYNEMATINSLEYLYKIYMEPPNDFKNVIRKFVRNSWPQLHCRINGWISGSAPPLFPVMNSEGFKIALEKANEKLILAVNSTNDQVDDVEFVELSTLLMFNL
ncbi:ubiquitin--protein ligase [Dictyocaulus viviparus]|uniref:Ubiquitin--protein ligase n=1 Tax=Dictyocaulus viviparus TaxID=29172 RepID=A0A0D8XVA2_DICVI|nr:ubiquitin--protein ligase [Dictyocaulus viviparus]